MSYMLLFTLEMFSLSKVEGISCLSCCRVRVFVQIKALASALVFQLIAKRKPPKFKKHLIFSEVNFCLSRHGEKKIAIFFAESRSTFFFAETASFAAFLMFALVSTKMTKCTTSNENRNFRRMVVMVENGRFI